MDSQGVIIAQENEPSPDLKGITKLNEGQQLVGAYSSGKIAVWDPTGKKIGEIPSHSTFTDPQGQLLVRDAVPGQEPQPVPTTHGYAIVPIEEIIRKAPSSGQKNAVNPPGLRQITFYPIDGQGQIVKGMQAFSIETKKRSDKSFCSSHG